MLLRQWMAAEAVRRRRHSRWLLAFGLLLCVFPSIAQDKPSLREVQLREDVCVRPLTEGVWLHTTYFNVPKIGRCPANGLIVVDGNDAVIIDLPWTEEQTGILFDWVAQTQRAAIRTVVPTHSHRDCCGGLGEAHRRGADSLALTATVDLLRKAKGPVPQRSFDGKTVVSCGQARIELDYVGPGHTVDNVVAWIPSKRLLFGGCLVKGQSATDLGNTTEADLAEYPKTLRELKSLYADAITVVPGHGEPGGLELIDHTLTLCEKALPE